MDLKNLGLVVFVMFGFLSCIGQENMLLDKPTSEKQAVQHTIVPVEHVQWSALNPARGKNSPRAANIWGNRTKDKATGFLVTFKDGFSSPPHIHNVTYKALVLHGEIHNDDPTAANMWMAPGSFWTQPKGEPHITSAKGERNMAYVEIEKGPYLVKPVDEAFERKEKPINIDASNVVWVKPPQSPVSLSYLWGKPQTDILSGTLVRFPKGFTGSLEIRGDFAKMIVVKGKLNYSDESDDQSIALNIGSFLGTDGPSRFRLSADTECILYVRTRGAFEVITKLAE